MIRVEKGTVELKGRLAELRSDLATIVHEFKGILTDNGRTEEEAVEIIAETVATGLLSMEELMLETIKELEKLIKKEGDE